MTKPNEYELIKFGEKGTCLYCCGNERYIFILISPDYKSKIFGSAGGIVVYRNLFLWYTQLKDNPNLRENKNMLLFNIFGR